MMAGWSGHLGPQVADLLDGRMSSEQEERAWQHVHDCQECGELVAREGWIKSRLCGLSAPSSAPSALKGCLLAAPGIAVAADGVSDVRRRLLGAAAVIGSGAAGAAMVGVLALGGVSPAQAPTSVDRRPAPGPTIANPVLAPTPAASQPVQAGFRGGSTP